MRSIVSKHTAFCQRSLKIGSDVALTIVLWAPVVIYVEISEYCIVCITMQAFRLQQVQKHHDTRGESPVSNCNVIAALRAK
jgi:hypothetical protein